MKEYSHYVCTGFLDDLNYKSIRISSIRDVTNKWTQSSTTDNKNLALIVWKR